MRSIGSLFPLIQLRHLSSVPITNGIGEAGDPENDSSWPRYIRTTDIATVRALDPLKRVTLPPQIAAMAPVLSDDILMTSAGTVGKSYIHLSGEEACFAGYLSRWRVRPDRGHPGFMAYWTESSHFLDQVQSGAVKSTIENYSAAKYRATLAPTPPIGEQRVIAEFLDRETAQIDAFIAKNEDLVALLTERRAAAIDAAFAPLGTATIKLKHLAAVQTGVTLGGGAEPDDPEWPYLRVANVQAGRVDLEEIKMVRVPEVTARRSLLRAGDVLMTEGGDRDKLGRGALWDGEVAPMLHQNHVFAVRVGARLDSRFLMRWLDGSIARRHFESRAVQTTNLASTNKTIVENLPLPGCALVVQKDIVEQLDSRIEAMSAAMRTARRVIALVRERRTALISAAVTGKIDVRAAA